MWFGGSPTPFPFCWNACWSFPNSNSHIHSLLRLLQVPCVSVRSNGWLSGKTRIWKEPSGPKCRSSGSHTSLAPPSKASTLWVFFLNNLQTLCSHDERTPENLVGDCFQGLVDATFWSCVWVFWEFKISPQGSIRTYLIYKHQNQPDDPSRSALQYACICKCVRMWQPATTLHTAGGPAAASCPSRVYS